jgi:hypothetical protein
MTITALIQKPVESKGVDAGLCLRLADEACRRAGAAQSWSLIVVGRLKRQEVAFDLAAALAVVAEKEAAELNRAIAALLIALERA